MNNYTSDFWLGLIVILIIVFIIFLILREFYCWYWKVNKRVELQTKTNELLQQIISNQQFLINQEKKEQKKEEPIADWLKDKPDNISINEWVRRQKEK